LVTKGVVEALEEAKGNFIRGCWFLKEDGFFLGGENNRLVGEKKT
jgi:hypothetical protein